MCMCVSVLLSMHTHVFISPHICVYICMDGWISAPVPGYMYVHICICEHSYRFECACISHVYTFVYAHVGLLLKVGSQ